MEEGEGGEGARMGRRRWVGRLPMVNSVPLRRTYMQSVHCSPHVCEYLFKYSST